MVTRKEKVKQQEIKEKESWNEVSIANISLGSSTESMPMLLKNMGKILRVMVSRTPNYIG